MARGRKKSETTMVYKGWDFRPDQVAVIKSTAAKYNMSMGELMRLCVDKMFKITPPEQK